MKRPTSDDSIQMKLVHCITYNHSAVAFKMGRRQGARRAHI